MFNPCIARACEELLLLCGLIFNFGTATVAHSVFHGAQRMVIFRCTKGMGAVIRGPRPPSVRWPRVGQRVRQSAQQCQPQLQVRTPQNQVKTSGFRPFVDPSVKLAASKERVLKLETALAAKEGMEGPEVESVRAAHKRARQAVQGAPFDIQIKECEPFFARAVSHLEELDTKRATICQYIEMSKKRLAESKAQSVAPPVQEDGAEVQQLRGLVSQLQATLRQNPSRDNQPEGPVLKRKCRREDFVPQCEADVWYWCRPHDVLQVDNVGEAEVVCESNTVPASPRALFAAGVAEPDNELPRDTIHDVQFPGGADREDDDSSSAGSESCWGEMEDIGDDEVAEWGALLLPTRRTESRIEPSSTGSPHWLMQRLSRLEQGGPRELGPQCQTVWWTLFSMI